MFADDLKLYTVVSRVADCRGLQRDIDNVTEWSEASGLQLNPDKCSVVSYSRARDPIHHNYYIGTDLLRRRVEIVDLGVKFQTQLTFHNHIADISRSSSRTLGFVLRNARELDMLPTIRLLYNSLVRSKMESSCIVWHPQEAKYCLVLERVQKTFLRFLYRRQYGYFPFLFPTYFILGMVNFFSLEFRRNMTLLIFIFKLLHGKISCPVLLSQISFFVPDKYIRAREHKLFAVPSSRTELYRGTLLRLGMDLVNRLLARIPECDVFIVSENVFRSYCIRFLSFC